jgi:signal transduction histidine kinase
LTPQGLARLGATLDRQEPWSDLPILFVTTAQGSRSAHARLAPHLARAGSITVLERPFPTVTLLTAARSALSARRRQYQLRELVAELHAETQRLAEERHLRERFVAILAHDLRGPLSTITTGVELLAREGVAGARRREVAIRAARNLRQMERMLRDLLDVQRIETGRRLPLRLRPCNLADVVRDVARELNEGHEDRFVVRGETRVEGIWSEDDLRRALWNLGTNALKYGVPGTPIVFDVVNDEEDACVSVHNEGDPIRPEDQETLFEPFTRTPVSEAGDVGGWGLGLALVRGCAEAHGGTVEVESSPQKGTSFTIRLPRDARPYQASEEPPESDTPDRPRLH